MKILPAGLNKRAGGFGLLSEEVSDVLEAKVMMGYRSGKTSGDIFLEVKSDNWLYPTLQGEGLDDETLLSYIEEMLEFQAVIHEPREDHNLP
jgi:hypothetical protein